MSGWGGGGRKVDALSCAALWEVGSPEEGEGPLKVSKSTGGKLSSLCVEVKPFKLLNESLFRRD